MPTTLKLGRYVDASGFPLAFVNIPAISIDSNISLVDKGYLWEENISSNSTSELQAYVGIDGMMPDMSATDFLVSNVVHAASSDSEEVPLYYKHLCRFYHYSYGDNPVGHIYITDADEVVLNGVNFLVRPTRISRYVYKIEVLTDFKCNSSTTYKVKYNRCDVNGENIYPSWAEILNVEPLFEAGIPTIDVNSYALVGPDASGFYAALVPPVPNITELTNTVGTSFENAPTIISNSLANMVTGDIYEPVSYAQGTVITHTLTATSANTFTIKRDYKRTGVATNASNQYLISSSGDSWGTIHNFSTGTSITGLVGISIYVSADNLLRLGDQATFTSSKSYYYINPISYESIYISKPKNRQANEDWYLSVKNGMFRRRMDSSGIVVPSGTGTLWEYYVPEFDLERWSDYYSRPYVDIIEERAVILDERNIQLRHSPIQIEPSSVLLNSITPGYPPSGFLTVYVNSVQTAENGIYDWNSEQATVTLAQDIYDTDDVRVNYIYDKDFYEYRGFLGSGVPYTVNPPYPYNELNLNPSSDIGHGVYASGLVASVFIRPYKNIDTGLVVNNSVLYHNFTGVSETDSGYRSGEHDFYLGDVSINPHCRISDIDITDVRTRGGGLNKKGIEELEKVKAVQPETEFFWDIGYFDGQAVPADGVLVVKVPKAVLKSGGGKFSQDEVRQKVNKHMALGEYSIIEYI